MNVTKRTVFVFMMIVLISLSAVSFYLITDCGLTMHSTLNIPDLLQGRLLPDFRELLLQDTTENGYMIPADDILDNADELKLTQIFWKYINTIQILCRNQTRVGSLIDGGKEICIDDNYGLKQPCLVYSFGSNFQFDFETDINRLFGCEIHTFDPSKSIIGKPVPKDILTFHVKGLSGEDYVNEKKWVLRKLSTIMIELNHETRVIDLLKIDTEGAEWVALPDIFDSNILDRVRQLSLEVHFVGERDDKVKQLKILRKLHELGFKIFMREHNLNAIEKYDDPVGAITIVNEISLVNVNFKQDTYS